MYNFKFKRINGIELALFDYGVGKLFKVLGNCWNFKQEKIELATKELLQFIYEEGCNYKVEAVYDTANQTLIIRSKKNEAII